MFESIQIWTTIYRQVREIWHGDVKISYETFTGLKKEIPS